MEQIIAWHVFPSQFFFAIRFFAFKMFMKSVFLFLVFASLNSMSIRNEIEIEMWQHDWGGGELKNNIDDSWKLINGITDFSFHFFFFRILFIFLLFFDKFSLRSNTKMKNRTIKFRSNTSCPKKFSDTSRKCPK